MSDAEPTGPLRLEPFRAVTYGPDVALARVTSPPYDVIGPDGVRALEASDAHNVVRLILPRPGRHETRYHHAARELSAWLADGVLEQDAEPALYVYEHSTPAGTALGLVGALALDAPILPHEGTFPGPVADRAALMTATGAQLEPILLTYEGGGPASDVVDEVRHDRPRMQATTPDGGIHRVWRVTSPALIRAVAADLAPRRALIADGHHRFAAYRAIARRSGAPPQASFGLALLVDAERHPLQLNGMHRAVAGLTFDTAIEAARAGFAGTELGGPAEARSALAGCAAGGAPGFVVTDGTAWALVHSPAAGLLEAALPPERSTTWRGLDAAIMKHALLEHLWRIDDAADRVTYHHDTAAAVGSARHGGGVAVLVNPPRLRDVLDLADRGERMPQKSTSFGPKPQTGLLMRLLRG